MRILMVTETFHPVVGGSETAIRELSNALVDLGHEVMVAVMNVKDASSSSTKFAFAKISSKIGSIDCKTLGKIRHCTEIIREFKPDVVNAHFLFESGFVGTAAAHRCDIPSVVSIRGRGIFFRPRNILEAILGRWWISGALKADAFLATSQEMADIAKSRFGITATALSNGVDTQLFHPNRRKDIRSPLGIAPHQRILFCARRLVPKNGIEYIVRALPLIREKENAVLLLAARKESEFGNLAKIADGLGMKDHVRFLGPLGHDELPDYYASADVVVQPSIAEARSLSCLEAMASGAVTVATATGGLKELLEDGKSGVLVEPFEESTYAVSAVRREGVERLARSVVRALRDETLRKTVQLGARKAAEQNSWPRIAEQTLSVYHSVLPT